MFKSFLLTCIVALGCVGFSFSQDKANTAKAGSKVALVEGKTSGNYAIILPEGINPEQVKKNASYYQNSFTVEYLEKSREAKIKMVENDDRNRHVIVRFLGACGVQYVAVDGKNLSTEEFFTTYMK
jgi:hypothetical protein